MSYVIDGIIQTFNLDGGMNLYEVYGDEPNAYPLYVYCDDAPTAYLPD